MSAGGALSAGPAEAALVQMPTQRLKNRYILVSAQLEYSLYQGVCLLYELDSHLLELVCQSAPALELLPGHVATTC